MSSVDSNFKFLCGRPHGAGPPFPVHLSLTPLPLRVDVINGWPLSTENKSRQLQHVRMGPRSFAVSGPTLWNSLPVELKIAHIPLETFKSKLKTYLFTIAYHQ